MNYYLGKVKELLIFSLAKLLQRRITGTEIQEPLFIVSCGRSGTTLLRKQLIENTFVHIPPESDDNIPQSIIYYTRNIYKPWNDIIDGVLNLWINSPSFKYWNLDLYENIDVLRSIGKDKQNLSAIINYIYTEHLKKQNPTATSWGDKTPYLVYRLRWLMLLYPKSKFVHQMRDGRNVILSRVRNFNESLSFALNKWNWSIEHWEKLKTPNKILIKYEDLVNNNDKTLGDVIEYLNLERRIEEGGSVDLGDDVLMHHAEIHKKLNKDHLYDYKIMNDRLSDVHDRDFDYNLKKYGYS